MKNSIKIITLFIFALMLCGCASKSEKTINTAYNNSKIGKNITGYVFDLRVYGTEKNNKIYKTVRINNYKNTDLEISIYTDLEQKQYAIKNGKTYLFNKDNKYEKADNLKYYTNPDTFLKAAKNIDSADFKETKEEGNKKYSVYSVEFDKKYMNKLLKNIDIEISTKKDVKGEIWLDDDSKIYKVNYKVNGYEIYSSFFAYNSTGSLIITDK